MSAQNLDELISIGKKLTSEQLMELHKEGLSEVLFTKLRDSRAEYEAIKKIVGNLRDFEHIWGMWCVTEVQAKSYHTDTYGLDCIKWSKVYPEVCWKRHVSGTTLPDGRIKVVMETLGRTCFDQIELRTRYPDQAQHSFALARLRNKLNIDYGYEMKGDHPYDGNPFHYIYHYNAPIFGNSDKAAHLAGTWHNYVFYRNDMSEVREAAEHWFRRNEPPEDAELKHWVHR